MWRESDVPKCLQATLGTIQFYRRAGEWDVESTGSMELIDELPTNWITAVVAPFLAAFPWAHLVETEAQTDQGFEGRLDLFLNWIAPDGSAGRSWLPGAGRLQVERIGPRFAITFTIWINLFTDEVYLYQQQSPDVLTRRLVPFRPAAGQNRRLVTLSLSDYVSMTNGAVVSCESELVDRISPDGFPDEASPV